jgi:CubicO group peptidase (beta-lactamase class C family)
MDRRGFLGAAVGAGLAMTMRSSDAADGVFPGKDWETATPESQGMTASGLDALKGLMQETGTRAGLVVRNGRVVSEWFWEDANVGTQFPVYSCTKSFASTAVGFLEAERKLKLDQPAADFIPSWKDDERKGVLIRHLLSMTSGQSKDEQTMYNSTDKIGFAIAQKLQSPPGTKWDYNNIGCCALSAVIAAAAGEEMSTYLKRKLYDRIGISHYSHEEPAGHTLPYSGLQINARDMARFGTFYLHEGAWKGKQLLPKSYVAAATRTSQDLNKGYGYLFWVNTASAWKDVPQDAFAARGAFGNELLVIPSRSLVVVRLLGTKQNSGIDMNKMGSLAVAACS